MVVLGISFRTLFFDSGTAGPDGYAIRLSACHSPRSVLTVTPDGYRHLCACAVCGYEIRPRGARSAVTRSAVTRRSRQQWNSSLLAGPATQTPP